MRFLSALLDTLLPLRATARMVRSSTSEELGALVNSSITESGITTLLPYKHPLVRAMIREAKFFRNEKALSLLATVLAEYVAAIREESSVLGGQQQILVPIPLSARRMRTRGYNQTEEIVRRTGLPFETKVLTRVRDTLPQTSLSRTARLKNMEGAFACSVSPKVSTTYIVFDDVSTTGATLLASKEAFQTRSGDVILLALARA